MKLSTAWVDQTQSQFDVRALPENHPAAEKLNETFGEHTFFVGAEGLHIVEETEPLNAGSGAMEVVKLASWRDDKQDTLEIHPLNPLASWWRLTEPAAGTTDGRGAVSDIKFRFCPVAFA